MGTKITVTIPRKGLSLGERKISFDVNGQQGTACTNLTASFERALSSAPAETELKAEYYETEGGREHLNLN